MRYPDNVVKERVYIGRSNSFSLRLLDDNSPAELISVTRIVLKLGHLNIDSDVHPEAFDWSIGNGEVKFVLGGVIDTPMTEFAELIIFDAGNADGLVWISDCTEIRLQIQVR